MKIVDLENLRRDSKQGNLYNLFEPTFRFKLGYDSAKIVVDADTAMRIDLVCNEVYKSTDRIDFLLSFNDIDNPLNIMEKDEIFFVSYLTIDDFRLTETDVIETRSLLTNANKSTKIDQNRQKYIEDNYSLPPTFLPEPREQVRFEGDSLVIGR